MKTLLAILLLPALALGGEIILRGRITHAISGEGVVLTNATIENEVQETHQQRGFKTKRYPAQTRTIMIPTKADRAPVFVHCDPAAWEPGREWIGLATETDRYLYRTNGVERVLRAFTETKENQK